MRSWRNWQTRTVQVRVGDHGGSNPFDRTTSQQTTLLSKTGFRPVFSCPAEIIKHLGISEGGDKFEVMEKDGGIFLCPLVVYPKEKLILMRQLTVKRQIL